MTKDTNSSELPGQSLFELTAQNLLPEEIALRVLTAVAEELQQLHESGRLHAALSLQTIWWDETTGNVVLAPRNELVFVGGVNADPDSTPFWLKTDHSLSLSNDLTQAQQTLNQSGISERAERIDLYQFAALACRLLSGESVTDYLRSPRIKAKVPVSIQSTIDRALGFQAADRFETATELVHALTGQEQENPSIHSQSDTDLSSLDAGQDTSVFSGGSRESASAQELPFTHLGHYEITGRIGHGGMGDVYKGFEKSLNRQVAIKVLPADFAQQEDFVRRFYAEASAAAKIVHPHIIPIHFIGEDQGCHFFAMQYVEGESLAQLLARRGKLSVDESLDLLAQVLSGLKAAHQHGLIHRDIKPANILLDRVHQRAVIADFGLVKSLQEEQTNTATGVVMGTVDYISPEQGRGQTVDHRSDLYSLGVLLYQLLSGKLPFTAESPTALIFQHVYERPQPLGEINKNVPEALSAVVAKLMAKSPEDRHASARAVLDDLQAIRTGEPLPSRADVALRSDPSAFSRLSDRSGPPQSLVITAPKFDDDPWLPEEIPEETTPSWWQRIKARLGAAAHRHAPELVEHWANTQQQVDLAVAEYQRRQQRLAELVHEADEVLNELRAREAEWRDVSNESQDTAFRTAEELHEAIEAQDNQLASMRLNLAKINATLETLKSQRDILQARLQAARVQKQFGRVTKTPAWKTWLKAATALSLLFIIGVTVSNIRREISNSNTGLIELAQVRNMNNVDRRLEEAKEKYAKQVEHARMAVISAYRRRIFELDGNADKVKVSEYQRQLAFFEEESSIAGREEFEDVYLNYGKAIKLAGDELKRAYSIEMRTSLKQRDTQLVSQLQDELNELALPTDLTSFAQSDEQYFIYHADYHAYANPVQTFGYKMNATWELVDGLILDGFVSIRSSNVKNHYLAAR